MNEIKVFNNQEFGEIRIMLIDGEPWFVGRDIASKLGYAKPENAISKWCDLEDTLKWGIPSKGGEQQTLIINESGLYSLIFGSKLESAKKFKKWVTSEVLPSIRKTGQYGQQRLPMTVPEQIQLLAQGNVELNQRVDDLEKNFNDFKNDMPILGIEETKITNAVRKKGVACLGGKESNAYKNRCLRGKLYADLYGQLRREFDVSTYKAIKRNQTDIALTIVVNYQPPMALSQEIDTENAQIQFDI